MSEARTNNNFGLFLKEILKKRSLSMRKLSELTEIDTATISRIINGKRKVNLQHLQKFSECLEVSMTELFEAAGYPIEHGQEKLDSDMYTAVEEIQHIITKSNLVDDKFSIASVEKHLSNYGHYSLTEEGNKTILTSFEEKLQKVGSIGPFISELKELFEKFRQMKGTPHELALFGGALLYFIIPVDVIPDYIFPIGYLDDAIAVQFVLNSMMKK